VVNVDINKIVAIVKEKTVKLIS